MSTTSRFASCSGERKRNSTEPDSMASKASAWCRRLCDELALTAVMPDRPRIEATWSRWSEISGETTTVGPSSSKAAIW
jgi:hypothetical protein